MEEMLKLWLSEATGGVGYLGDVHVEGRERFYTDPVLFALLGEAVSQKSGEAFLHVGLYKICIRPVSSLDSPPLKPAGVSLSGPGCVCANSAHVSKVTGLILRSDVRGPSRGTATPPGDSR